MAGTGPGDFYNAASELFDVCVAALSTTPGGVPDCRYISPGPPSYDACPCLIVYSTGPAVGDTFPLQPALAPGHRAQTQGLVIVVGFSITILRCAPLLDDGNTLPQPSDFDAASQLVLSDCWAIVNGILRAKRNNTLFAPREREMLFDPAIPVIQHGGCCGWDLRLRVAVEGYTP